MLHGAIIVKDTVRKRLHEYRLPKDVLCCHKLILYVLNLK